jgi:hypothetical protein
MVAGVSGHDAHLLARVEQLADDVGADVSGATG